MSSKTILNLARDFQSSRALHLFVEFDLHQAIKNKQGLSEIIASTKYPPELIRAIFFCLLAEDILIEESGHYIFKGDYGELFDPHSQRNILDAIRWASIQFRLYSAAPSEVTSVVDTSIWMSSLSQTLKHSRVEDIIIQKLKDRDKVIEVGCGEGILLSQLATLGKHLNLTGIDRPWVVRRAYAQLSKSSKTSIQLIGGDFERVDWPSEVHMILAVNFLHVLRPAQHKLFMDKAYFALLPGGCLLVIGPILDEQKPSRDASRLNLSMALHAGLENPKLSALMELGRVAGFTYVTPLAAGQDCQINGVEYVKE